MWQTEQHLSDLLPDDDPRVVGPEPNQSTDEPGKRPEAAWTPPVCPIDSILALSDIRHRLVVAHAGAKPPSIQELLALDPPTIIRLLRISRAPLHAAPDRLESIDDLVRQFGRIMVRRALEVRPAPSAGSEAARTLWFHAIATAHACQQLARSCQTVEPDVAYLRGLLIDLPEWGGMLTEFGRHGTDRFRRLLGPFMPGVPDRAKRRQRAISLGQPDEWSVDDLLSKGELLASLAGYWHPGDTDVAAQESLLSEITREDLIAAQNLRSKVAAVLDRTNLLGTEHVTEQVAEHLPVQLEGANRLFEWRRGTGNLADVVTSLLNCSAALRYRGIITATTAASLRFLDYERAVLAVWNRELQCCWLRAKSDMTPQPLEPLRVQPNQHELHLLSRALELGVATRLPIAPGDEAGLLESLGVDEVLCVPINTDFHSPSFLFLDRTLTRREIVRGDDLKAVTALASTASILNENLLLKKIGQRAKRFALTDPLTRLYNRGVGMTTLEREIERSRRSVTPLTVLMLDLDDFKELNDKFGHLRGDAALRVSADVLRRTLRKPDTVCRYGGEEFMVVLPETSVEQASIIATRIFTEMELTGQEHGLPLTVSIGLTEVDSEKDDVESVLLRADHALYASKARGRNRFSVDSVK